MYTLLQNLLRGRLFNDGPVQIGIVGAGKFGTGLAVQLAAIDGINVGGVADLEPRHARHAGPPAGGYRTRPFGSGERFRPSTLHPQQSALWSWPTARTGQERNHRAWCGCQGSPWPGALHRLHAIEQASTS